MTEKFIFGEISTAHLELRREVQLDVYRVLGPGLIHSDRVVCQMQFSAKHADWSLLRRIPWQSFSGGRNNLKCCVTELAEPKKSQLCARWQLKPECQKMNTVQNSDENGDFFVCFLT